MSIEDWFGDNKEIRRKEANAAVIMGTTVVLGLALLIIGMVLIALGKVT